jgi:small subunit ribosomal protein S14
MAKKSMINKDIKRAKIVAKYRTKRLELKKIIKSVNVTDEERFQAIIKLKLLPRDASPIRQRSRCGLTGRPHGFYRKFGLSRNKLRELVMNGEVSGLSKSSW